MEILSNWGDANGGLYFLGKYGHVLAGITWIGLLYFFNFIQVPAFGEMSPEARLEGFDKLTWRTLWWFRMAAAATFATGALMWGLAGSDFEGTNLLSIAWGSILGTTMFLNVWGIIWRAQKTNIGSMRETGKPHAESAKIAARASRVNTFFSFSMLFFMLFTSHYSFRYDDPSGGKLVLVWVIFLATFAFIEASALGFIGGLDSPFNKLAFDSYKNTIIGGLVYWLALLLICWELIIGGR